MRRIDTATKKEIQYKNGKSFDGFVEGNPKAKVEATHLSDSWCNNLQEEICNVIEGVGHKINDETTPSGNNKEVRVEKYDQMFQAIKLLVDAVTPIGSVKAMSVKMTENIAKWVPIDEDDDDDDEAESIIGTEGTAYLSKEMAKNCEQVDGNKAGWYKLISINKENGDPSGVSGWALADGTFPLPLKPFGEDDGTRPIQVGEIVPTDYGESESLSGTEYASIWRTFQKQYEPNITPEEQSEAGGLYILSSQTSFKQKRHYFSLATPWLNRYSGARYYNIQYEATKRSLSPLSDHYFIKDEDVLPPKDDTEGDTEIDLSTWRENNTKKPKLIPNLNDKTFLMGSSKENLPLTVEGKNGFIMKPYHMPPHAHIGADHKHAIPTYGASSAGSTGSEVIDEDTIIYTNSNTSKSLKTDTSESSYTGITGGYVLNNSNGNIMDKNGVSLPRYLHGTVPIDLRPKRLQVYYYIRVI